MRRDRKISPPLEHASQGGREILCAAKLNRRGRSRADGTAGKDLIEEEETKKEGKKPALGKNGSTGTQVPDLGGARRTQRKTWSSETRGNGEGKRIYGRAQKP